MMLRSACAVLSLAFAALAFAQEDSGVADITGAWAFETDAYDLNPADDTYCSMTGELTLRATGDPDVFEGDLLAYESCRGARIFEAHQDVVAVRSGDALVITSTLRRVLPSPDNYRPDDFELTIVSGALMTGELRSADIAPATFRRQAALVS